MATRFHAARQRRAERSTLLGQNLNLVPLVDMLVSILFFSLITYSGASAFLISFDLALPPVIQDPAQEQPGPQLEELDLILTVRMEDGGLQVDYASREGGGFTQRIEGLDEDALEEFQGVMQQIRAEYPDNRHVLVIPQDESSYDDVVHVLERITAADYDMIALGQRLRATQVAAAGGGR